MKPIDYTGEDLTKLKNKIIEINYQYKSKKFIWIKGKITQVYLAFNPPNLPGSIDFELVQESIEELEKAGIVYPNSLSILEIDEIKE